MSQPDAQRLAVALEADIPREVLDRYQPGAPRRAGSPWRLLTVDEAIAANRSARTWVPEIAALRFFWTDGQSGLAGVATAGPVRGTVATVISTRPSYAPRFRSVASFLAAGESLDEDDEWEDEMAFDYPATGDLASADQTVDAQLVARLEQSLLGAPDARRHAVACLLAVTPPAQAASLVAFADDPDDELAAATCVRLARVGYTPAIPRLVDIAFGARGVPGRAAAGALATMGAAAAAPTLTRLATRPVPDPVVAATILDAAGVDVREASGGWQYRDPVRDTWRDIPV